MSGGGGGGSGGAVILQAAGKIYLEADVGHVAGGFTDGDGDDGATIDVSGGMGRDVQTSPKADLQFNPFTYDVTRSDGGQGGMGLIQLHVGDGTGKPVIEQGAFLFARKRVWRKQGPWTGDSVDQKEHPSWATGAANPPPDDLRYIDMLHYPEFKADPTVTAADSWYVLNGSFPPIVQSENGKSASSGSGLVNTYGGGVWWDTPMMEHPDIPGFWVVQEPHPEWVMKTYNTPVDFKEVNDPVTKVPGTTHDAGEVLPMSVRLQEPSGIPLMADVGGTLTYDPSNLVDRLPVVPPSKTPPTFGTTSTGISRWLDFNGVATRMRDGSGRPPPFFQPFHGTYNAAGDPIPAGKEGEVITGAAVPGKPAHYVENAGSTDTGLFGEGVGSGGVPYNDVKVDAPDLLQSDAISDNATVTVLFQGAYPVRAGSSIPDAETLTDWVADLTELTGHPLVRFKVTFDLTADPGFEFNVDSLRPKVDELRLRTGY
jgi:hypothetical protein